MSSAIKDYSLAARLRSLTTSHLLPYANISQTFYSDNLRSLLTTSLGYREYEVSYQLMKILFTGSDKYQSVTLDELVDYVIDKFVGETAVVRYSGKVGYQGKEEREMRLGEFVGTVAEGFTFLPGEIQQEKRSLEVIFGELDEKKRGKISFLQYAEFIKDYIGSGSPMAVDPMKGAPLAESQQAIPSQKSIEIYQQHPQIPLKPQQLLPMSIVSQLPSPLILFHDLIIRNLFQKFTSLDQNKDGYLTRHQAQQFLYDSLELEMNSIEFVLNRYLPLSNYPLIQYNEFLEVVCEVHFREVLSALIKQELNCADPRVTALDRVYFIAKLIQNCYFFSQKPSEELLGGVFDILIARSNLSHLGRISLEDVRNYFLVQCCGNRIAFRQQSSRRQLLGAPAIAEVEDSHCQQDQSEGNEGHEVQIREGSQGLEGQIGLSSNPRTRTNPFSEESIGKDQSNSHSLSEQQLPKQPTPPRSISHQAIRQATIEHQPPLQQPPPFKTQLWKTLLSLASKATSNDHLSSIQLSLFLQEQCFDRDRKEMTQKWGSFLREGGIKVDLAVGFVIHFKGEQALREFHRNQVKGKSSLGEAEVSEVLRRAYGCIVSREQVYIQLARTLLAESQKTFLPYRQYLQLVARNFAIKNPF